MSITAKSMVLIIDDELIRIPSLKEQLSQVYEGPRPTDIDLYACNRMAPSAEERKRTADAAATEEKRRDTMQRLADSLERQLGFSVTVPTLEQLRERLGEQFDMAVSLRETARLASIHCALPVSLRPESQPELPLNRAQRRRAAYEHRQKVRRG